MKTISLIVTLLTSITTYGQTDLSKLEWLVGSWQRTNAKPGRLGVETWEKTSATEFVGLGVSLKGADTMFVEKLKIIVKGNAIFYVADVPENKSEVYFKAILVENNNVVFENLKHDFPKRIAYEFDGSKLKATTSADAKIQEFWFERK